MWYQLFAGFVGMCLSEVFIWNTRTITPVINRGALPTLLGILVAWMVYTLMMSWFVDLVIRHKVRDTIGILLLGSLYGLVNEGLFAKSLYAAGGSPLGISILFLSWPTLSWHPFMVAFFTWRLFRSLVENRPGWSPCGLSWSQAASVVGVCAFWFPWQYAKWQQIWFPAGIEPKVQLLFLLFPLIAGGMILAQTLKTPGPDLSNGLLSNRQRKVAHFLLVLAGILHWRMIPAKQGFPVVLAVMAFYWLLFKYTRPSRFHESNDDTGLHDLNSNGSSCAEALQFPWKAWFQTSGLVVLSYAVFHGLTANFALKPIWSAFSILGVLVFLIMPVILLFKALYQIMLSRPGGSLSGPETPPEN